MARKSSTFCNRSRCTCFVSRDASNDYHAAAYPMATDAVRGRALGVSQAIHNHLFTRIKDGVETPSGHATYLHLKGIGQCVSSLCSHLESLADCCCPPMVFSPVGRSAFFACFRH